MNRTEIREMLQHIKSEDLYSFVLSYAEEDELFSQKLKEQFLPGNTDNIDLMTYRIKAKACFNFSESRAGRYRRNYDSYQAALDAGYLLDQLLSDADYFLKHEEYSQAAGLAMAVTEIIPVGYEYVDDSGGGLAQTFHSASESIISILRNKQVDRKVKETIYKWAKEEVEKPEYQHYGFEDINKICDAARDELGETDDVLAEIDRRIEIAEEYEKEEIILRKIRFMQSRNLNTEELVHQNMHINAVRRIAFEQMMENGEYDKALTLAEKGQKEMKDPNFFCREFDWNDAILDCYLKQRELKKLLAHTEKIMIQRQGWKFEKYYQTLKTYTNPEEWSATLERILTAFEEFSFCDQSIAEIMVEHQFWKRLLEYCKRDSFLYNNLEKYETYLRPHFEKELLDIYIAQVEEAAPGKNYHYVAHILKHIRTFQGGDDIVNKKLQEFRQTYKQRRKMMAILNTV